MAGRTRFVVWALAVLGILFLGLFDPGNPPALAQQPTGSIPTVTGTPEGPFVTVDGSIPVIRVYAGPSSFEYPSIGVMIANETAPMIGVAKDRIDWIQIRYPGVPGSVGWVYAPYVKISRMTSMSFPVIDIPSTPTPFATPTINPTLEVAYIGQQTPTRLPTFTPPPPLDVPLFTDAETTARSIPAGLLIVLFGLFGFLGAVISYLRGR